MDLLSTFSDDDEEDDDDIIYCNFSNEDDLLELELLQRIRNYKWVHQRLNWLATARKLFSGITGNGEKAGFIAEIHRIIQ